MWSGSQQAPEYSIRNGLAIIHTYQTKQQESSKDLTPLFSCASNTQSGNLFYQFVIFGQQHQYKNKAFSATKSGLTFKQAMLKR